MFLNTDFVCTSQQAGPRPKVGLALSGGGSLGMAHIGVLKVMEEAGLRPDFITGVSMGSIVGSLYSIGYSADSLQKMFRNADWGLILSNNLPENKVIFTEKKYFDNSIMAMPVTKKKVRLPSGLINGQQIEKMLSYYAWPAADISDFSKLPIPFMCLGTDLITCKKVVLSHGYLPDAIRASMAVPSVFTPLKIDTAILIDGGFIRNFAVSELRDMGADIVIGSYTGFLKYNESELQSVSGVLKQLSFFNTINDYSEQKKLVDVLIEPKVRDLSSTVFSNSDTIISRGYLAALPFREKFRAIADSLSNIGKQEPARSLLDNYGYAFNKIEISGNDVITDDQILGVLDIRLGDEIQKDELSEKIDLLYGRAWFDKVKYRIVPRQDSMILQIDCIEKPQAILYGSVHYDNSREAGILLSLSVRNLLTPGSVIDIDSYIAKYFHFRFNYTQFIDRNQKLGISAFFNSDNVNIPVLEINDETGQFTYRSFATGINLNSRTGLNHLLTLSAGYENMSLLPEYISESQLKKITFNYLNTSLTSQYNTLRNKHFPDKGVVLTFSLNSTNLINGKINAGDSKETYRESDPGGFLFKRTYCAAGNFRQYFSPWRKISFDAGGDFYLSYTADSSLSPQNYFFAGGTESFFSKSVPLTGFRPNEIPVEQFAGLRLNADIEFHKDLHLLVLTGFGVAIEPGNDENTSFLGGYGIGLGYMSLIGPLKIGFMQGISNTKRYFGSIKGFISLGYSF